MEQSFLEHHMREALALAEQGFPKTRPNPMVGAVLVDNSGKVIGRGFHQAYGQDHAEVNCFKDAIKHGATESTISAATLFVTLEPCSHTGKTPPCIDAIRKYGIKRIVIGTLDPNPAVNGSGVKALKELGAEVMTDVLAEECRSLNKRFFCFHEKHRPYVILKWAQTSDGYIARNDGSSKWISGEGARGFVHKWRDEEMAIMVGTNTAIIDNPFLTSRIIGGRNPVRVIVDREQKIPTSFNVFDESAPTLLFNAIEDYKYDAAELIKIDFNENVLQTILRSLFERGLQSLIVEGGAKLISSFISNGVWDEARIFVNEKKFGDGIHAPFLALPIQPAMTFAHDRDKLFTIEFKS